MPEDLVALLARQDTVILDGGLGTELEYAGLELDDPLWSARVLMEQPEAIAAVHRAFLRCGADVITSASYQATYEGFAQRGLSRDEAEGLMTRSVALAREVRDAFWGIGGHPEQRARPLVAASVGPYGALLADGSEYRGGYGKTATELADFHGPRLETLLAAGADVLACETVPCPEEAEGLRIALSKLSGARAWIAFSCRDGAHVCQGEPFAECVALLDDAPEVVAVGINCTAPEHVVSLLEAAAKVTETPLVAYPNSSEVWDAEVHVWRPGGDRVPDLGCLARDWRAAGARLIGGCCRTRPTDILCIRKTLLGAGCARCDP